MDSLFSLSGRVALVTGGTSGIGQMIAKGLVERGVKTYIVGRNPETCKAAAKELSEYGVCLPLVGDLATLAGANAVVEQLSSHEQCLHILVNNAGAMYDAPIDDFTEEGWDQVLDLNLKSVFFLTKNLLPLMRVAAGPDHQASVINIGSMGGTRVGPKENYSYQASKAGLHHLTGSLAKRLAPENITVNAIAPGFFLSRMTTISDEQLKEIERIVPRRRIGKDDDVVGAVVHLASKAGGFITGAVIPLDGGMTL
jgi:NAD(P)-dependent dehydrogenase (short-subunit alcohol dehydrogenase family)